MAGTEIAYKNLLPTYLKIKETEFIGMNRPREVIIGESLKLASYSKEDLPEFETVPRFNPELIAFLPERIDGFIHAANEFFFAEELPAKAKAEWAVHEPEAMELKRKVMNRRKMIATEEGDLTTIKDMNRIAVGQGRYDLLDDVTKLNRMAKKDAEKLASIGVTAADLKKLDEFELKLKALIGDIDRAPEGLAEKKSMMFRAYTHLMQAVNPICEYGQILFEGTDRAELYKSQSLSERGAQSASKAPVSSPEAASFGI